MFRTSGGLLRRKLVINQPSTKAGSKIEDQDTSQGPRKLKTKQLQPEQKQQQDVPQQVGLVHSNYTTLNVKISSTLLRCIFLLWQ